MANSVAEQKTMSAWRSPWVIGWIGLIIAVLGVNLTMVYFAIISNPGLVVDDYYDRGQHYEHTMVSKMLHRPDWVFHVDIPQGVKAGERTAVRFFVVDKTGQPVDPDRVTFHAYRPSDASRDFSVTMKEEGKGRYMAEVSFPLIGVWDTLFSVATGKDEYNEAKRVHVERP